MVRDGGRALGPDTPAFVSVSWARPVRPKVSVSKSVILLLLPWDLVPGEGASPGKAHPREGLQRHQISTHFS